MADAILVSGMFVKDPHSNAPDFVKMRVSFKVEDFKKFLDENEDGGYVNVQIKRSQEEKLYASLDTWRPDPNYNRGDSPVNDEPVDEDDGDEPVDEDDEDDLPF